MGSAPPWVARNIRGLSLYAAEEEVASRRRPGGRWPGHLGPRRPAVLPEEGLEVAGGVDLRGGPRRGIHPVAGAPALPGHLCVLAFPVSPRV